MNCIVSCLVVAEDHYFRNCFNEPNHPFLNNLFYYDRIAKPQFMIWKCTKRKRSDNRLITVHNRRRRSFHTIARQSFRVCRNSHLPSRNATTTTRGKTKAISHCIKNTGNKQESVMQRLAKMLQATCSGFSHHRRRYACASYNVRSGFSIV